MAPAAALPLLRPRSRRPLVRRRASSSTTAGGLLCTLVLLLAFVTTAFAHPSQYLAPRQQNGGLQGGGVGSPSTGSGSSDLAPHIPSLTFTDQAVPWQYKVPYSTDGNRTIAGGKSNSHTTDISFSACDAGQVVEPDVRINVSAVFAHVNPSNHTPGAPAQGELKIVALGAVNALTYAVKNGSRLVSSVETESNFLTFPVAYKLESLCDRLWPTGPDDDHPLAGRYQSCSYGPGPVAFGVPVPLKHQYNMGSVQTRIRISDSSTPALTISCIDVTVSPYKSKAWYWDLFLWLPAALVIAYFLLTVISRTVTSISLRNLAFKHKARPGGEPNFWKDKLAPTITDVLGGDSVIQSPALLRFVTPGFVDLWLYIQFVSVLAMIAVRWPDFSYVYFRQTAWASLLGNVTLVQPSGVQRLEPTTSNALLPAQSQGSPDFASQMTTNTSSPLYLDTQSPNTFLNLNGSLGGMESYAHMLGLRSVDVFGTTTAIWLIIVGAVTLLSLGVWLVDTTHTRRLHKQQRDEGYTFDLTDAQDDDEKQEQSRINTLLQRVFGSHINAFTGNLLRLLHLFHLPLTAVSVYHFSNFSSSHPGTTACAALSFAFFCVLFPAFALRRLCLHQTANVWTDKRLLLSFGPLYNYYDRNSRLFPIITFTHSLVLGIVVGAGQKSGSAQSVIFLVLEVLLALAYILWLPWGEGATMAPLSFAWSVARIATSVLVLLLSSMVGLSLQARGWITYVILLIQAIIAVGFVLLLIVKVIEAVVRLAWHVSFDDNKSPRNTGLDGAMHRIRRRKYKSTQLRKPSRKSKTPFGPRSRTPSMNLMMNGKTTPKPHDFAQGPYASYFTDAGDDSAIMSALPPLRGVPQPENDSGASPPGGFVRLGGGRATDEGHIPSNAPTTFQEDSPNGIKSKKFGKGLWWRRVPMESSENESLSSSDDDDYAYGLGDTHASRKHTTTTSKPKGWNGLGGAFKRLRGATPSPSPNEAEEMNELSTRPPSSGSTPAFSVVRPPRGTLSALAASGPSGQGGDQPEGLRAAPLMEQGVSGTSTAGVSSSTGSMTAPKALRSTSQGTRGTVGTVSTNDSQETDTPRGPTVKAAIRTPQQLYSLSESTHNSSSEPVQWLGTPEPSPVAPRIQTPQTSSALEPEPEVPSVAPSAAPVASAVPTPRSPLGQAPASGSTPAAPGSAADMYAPHAPPAPLHTAQAPDSAASGGGPIDTLAATSNPFISPANNQSLLSVGASMHSRRRLVEGQSAEILTLDYED